MSQDKNINLPSCSKHGNTDEQTIMKKRIEMNDIRKKIIRTPLTLIQKNRLEEEFRKKNIITKKTRTEISNSINLDKNIIKYWFQNRRSIQKKSWLNQGYVYIKYKSININLHQGLESKTSLENLAKDLTEIELIDFEIEEFYTQRSGIEEKFEQTEPLKNYEEFGFHELFTVDDTMEFWNLVPLTNESSSKVEELVSTLPEENIEKLSCSQFEPCTDENQQESSSYNLDDTLEYWDALSSQNVSVTSSENTSPQRIKIIASWTKSSPNSFTKTPSTKFEQSEACNNRQIYVQESVVQNSSNADDDAMEYWDSLSSPYVSITNPDDFNIYLPQTNIITAFPTNCTTSKLRSHNNNEELLIQNSLNSNNTTEFWDSFSSANVFNTNTDNPDNILPQTNINAEFPTTSKLESFINNQELVVQNSLNNNDEMVYWDSISLLSVSNTNPEDQINVIAELPTSCTTSQLESLNSNHELVVQNSLKNKDEMVFWDLASLVRASNINSDDVVSTLPQANIIDELPTSCTTSKLESYNNNQELVVENPLNNNHGIVYWESPNISNTKQDDLVSTLPQLQAIIESPSSSSTTSVFKQPKPYKNNQEDLFINDDTMEFWDSLLAKSIRCNKRAEDLVSTLPEIEEEEDDDDDNEETNNVVRKSGKAPTLSEFQRYMLEKMYRGLNSLSRATRRSLTSLIGITMKQFRSWLSWRKKKHGILLKRYNEYGVDPIPTQFKRPTSSSNEDAMKLLNENVIYIQVLDDHVDLSQNTTPEVVNNLDIDGLLQRN